MCVCYRIQLCQAFPKFHYAFDFNCSIVIDTAFSVPAIGFGVPAFDGVFGVTTAFGSTSVFDTFGFTTGFARAAAVLAFAAANTPSRRPGIDSTPLKENPLQSP